MKFSEAWLREWVDPPVSVDELADQLSMAGLEVDGVAPVAPDFSGVVVGEVLSVEPHPNADKLRLCQLRTGADEPLAIICGASNVAAGMRVPTAVVGAELPGGFSIKKAKLRGVASFGMICSAAELGLAESSDGIMPLPVDAPVGQDFREYLRLADRSIELDLTPDRGDCLGLAGIAREVGVINRQAVNAPSVEPVEPECEDRHKVSLQAGDACPRYLCRVVRGIDPAAQTPLWMQERLRRSGIRSLGPVVDVTNYVLIELGQPMHGFDLARLDGGIRVRMAHQGESLELLDGQRIELTEKTLLIADETGPLALAGIMGGLRSGVGPETSDVLLESAFFAPTAIIGKARSYGLHTDSSHRFERGVDPNLQRLAMERATGLLIEIAGGRAGPVVEACKQEALPAPEQILLRRERVCRLLGVEVPDAEIEDILTRLGMQLEATDQGWKVIAPTSRFDIAIEVDLIEEIGRIYGYTRIPATHAPSDMSIRARPETDLDIDRVRSMLVDRGYQEAITYSFISPELQGMLDPEHAPVQLANPISTDMSVMRTSLWPGLLQATQYNHARQQERTRFFETGLRFVEDAEELHQEDMLAGAVSGPVTADQWDQPARAVDFFDLKGDVEAILALTGDAASFRFIAGEHPALHPRQAARIEREGRTEGWMGMLHPEIQHRLGLDRNLFLFELRLEGIRAGTLPAFRPLSKFPSIRRDLAVVVDAEIGFSQVRDCVETAAPDILQDIRLFDVYTGEKIDSGRKSLALTLILQDSSHTLTDDEVDAAVKGVMDALSANLNAQLRD
jgi:phenylalanyl-tRNA synthetase beta chain